MKQRLEVCDHTGRLECSAQVTVDRMHGSRRNENEQYLVQVRGMQHMVRLLAPNCDCGNAAMFYAVVDDFGNLVGVR